MKASDYLNIIAQQLHPYMASAFPTGNGIFQQDNTPCHKAHTALEWFLKHNAGFQLMLRPLNSPDLNPIERISDVMERHITVPKTLFRNIPDFRDRCLNIWCNMFPVIHQRFLASTPRRIAAVLRAKVGPKRS